MDNIAINLTKWDLSENALAPLSHLQKTKINNLEEAILQLDLTSNSNSSGSSLKISKNDNKIEDGDNKIEAYRQLLGHYGVLEARYDAAKCSRYFNYLEQLKKRTDECHHLCMHIEKTLEDFSALSKQYAIVSVKTMTLHNATEQLISEQEKLNSTYNNIVNYVKYFKEAHFIMDKLEMANLSVRSDVFMQLTNTIETNIDFIETNIGFKEAKIYLIKYRHCQSKVISMMQQWIHDLLDQATDSILNPSEFTSNNIKEGDMNKVLGCADTALALFYGRFQRILPKIKPIIDLIEKRSINNREYENLLGECQQYYLMKRGLVLDTSVRKGLLSIKDSYKGDHCSLVRQACALLLHASIDEYRLFYQFFSVKSTGLGNYLEGLCNALYDTLRPSIIHINHLETLAEICCILRIEMLEEHVQNNSECLEGFGNVCLQLLHDAQERLVFRAHLYLQSDVVGYNPSPGDLAYPDKLKMMEDIAETLREETRQRKYSNAAATMNYDYTDSTSAEQGRNNSHINATFEPMYKKSNLNNSPADLHGMWYPTVRRTLVCLSRLYRCVDRPVFQSLSREAITLCVQSIESAKDKITARATELDGQLFQIKHLLILREQIAPFQVDFTVKEYSLDFSQVKTAAYGLLEKRSRLFTLSNNALLEFFLEGAPRMKEHLIDSRKHVDVKLKLSCHQFIQHITQLLVEPIINFLDKVKSPKLMAAVGDNNQTNNEQQNDPQKIAAIVNESLRFIKFRLPSIQQSMQLYLANRETEFILFRPIRNNVVGVYTQLYQFLQSTFDTEQLQLIACPLPEQISIMLSSTSLAHARSSSDNRENNDASDNSVDKTQPSS
ncbi:conserved oligomeric Golgi complex subunit 3 [Microplitis mediator]|uniref:conserved oligomeric Golgi complex subunit 3 n=1 Tax=Microplitis mediator TaxID=375433 RepID=UPI0025521942|nr:conserved oligomeric Golgi complex subunit 3 [Microplitis mediator]XP_057324095.1 conserved oligomeric Golgi complex subunit 3 [Microplitis mediator]